MSTSKLALDGGTPVRSEKIPLTVPYIGEEEAAAAAQTIRSTWISSNGSHTRELESALAEYLGVKHALLVSNCTTAMDLALMAAGIDHGEVIVPTYTFAATGLAPMLRGCRPILAECEPDTANLDPAGLTSLITPDTRAIMPVHYAGHPCDMDAIYKIAAGHDLIVIEDAAQALGAQYKGLYIGALPETAVSCFSFHAIKNVTCGEGGAITTNDDALAGRARAMRDKGTNKENYHHEGRVGFYDYVSIGSNYMLSEILASVALVQFKKLDRINALRREHAQYLLAALQPYDKIQLPVVKDYARSNWHIFQIRVPQGKAEFFSRAMNAEGVQANVHWPPLHLTSLYKRQYGYQRGDFPIAERVFDSLVRLPLYPGLTQQDLDDLVRAVDKIHGHL